MKNSRGFVAEECGFGFGFGFGEVALVKLIYTKYLNELDHRLWHGFRDSSVLDRAERVVNIFESLLQELEEEVGDTMAVSCNKGLEDVKLVVSELDKSGNGTDFDKRLRHCSSGRKIQEARDCLKGHVDNGDGNLYLDNDLVISAKQAIEKAIKKVHGFSKVEHLDDDEKTCSRNENGATISAKKVIERAIGNVHDTTVYVADVDEDGCFVQGSGGVMSSAKSVVDKVIDSRKRKRESSLLLEMLTWVKNIAKHPDDVTIGRLPECSKWKHHKNRELWFQALLARKALLIKRHVNLNVESSLVQKKWRIHPSMYEEDILNHQSVEKSRCSQRLPLAKSHSCSCCKSAPPDNVTIVPKAEVEYSPKEALLQNVDKSAKRKIDRDFLDEPSEKEVYVGPLFQAKVPEWTGVVCYSDAKWLGKRMWPPEDVKDGQVVELEHIGKGRRNTCDCSFPGNVECIRFHIAEKRLKLKRELGLLFYKWRFDHMGEEVSLSWTAEQEKKFKDMIRLNNESINKFWGNAFELFPSKTREKLVSYYFNVFLVKRRSYQNRVTPKDVDSDDDEKEFGSVGDSFGYKAIYVPESRLPICFENKQCAELE